MYYKICGVFEPMQRDLGNLSNTNRRILSFAGYALVILITAFLKVSLGISSIICGLILGFLGAIIDTLSNRMSGGGSCIEKSMEIHGFDIRKII